MRTDVWLTITKTSVVAIRKNKPPLEWNEIAVKLSMDIPDELFKRPTIEARMVVKDVPNVAFNPEIILNTADLIEQQTGAKINFTVVHEETKQGETNGN